MRFLACTLLLSLIACQPAQNEPPTPESELLAGLEAVTLGRENLRSPAIDQKGNAWNNYLIARAEYLKNPKDADALIWYGRRTAYLGYFQKAIERYTEGIEQHPKDARFYRHRGHRYLSTRQYDKAIADFEQAVQLTAGQKDQTEPDGLPNAKNIPLTTLQGNIWYHLGLAYYLTGDLDNALRAFSNRSVTEKYDDNLVSGGHWQYMILRRQGKVQEAATAIAEVHPEMSIIENESYYRMCLFYQGILSEEDLVVEGESSSANDVYLYGLGNWYLYEHQDSTKAKAHYGQLLENGNPYSFAYLAAEADWQRWFAPAE